MATNYPTSLDSYVTKVDNTDDVLAAHVNNLQDAIEAMEAKVGVNSSAVNTSFDYFLKHAAGAYRTHIHDGSSDDGSSVIGDLTALTFANNIDVGNYQLRAKQVYADVPTGISPLLVDSATLVSNLNADKLDNQEGSYYTNATNISSGTLAVARGGTGQDFSASAQGSVLYFSAAGVLSNLGPGTSGQYLKTNGGGADPSFADITLFSTYDSGWFSISGNTGYTKTHNLGTTNFIGMIWAKDVSGNISTPTIIEQIDGANWTPPNLCEPTTTTVKIRVSNTTGGIRLSNGATTTITQLRVLLIALE